MRRNQVVHAATQTVQPSKPIDLSAVLRVGERTPRNSPLLREGGPRRGAAATGLTRGSMVATPRGSLARSSQRALGAVVQTNNAGATMSRLQPTEFVLGDMPGTAGRGKLTAEE